MANFDAIARRPAAYLAETGLPQLGSGLIFFFIGGSVLIQRLLPRTPLYLMTGPWIGVCCTLFAMFAIATIKRRVVFPRGGYVVPVGRTRRWLYFGITVLIAVAVWAFVLTTPDHLLDLLGSRLVWPGFAITLFGHLPVRRPATEERFDDIFRSLSGMPCSAALLVAGKQL